MNPSGDGRNLSKWIENMSLRKKCFPRPAPMSLILAPGLGPRKRERESEHTWEALDKKITHNTLHTLDMLNKLGPQRTRPHQSEFMSRNLLISSLWQKPLQKNFQGWTKLKLKKNSDKKNENPSFFCIKPLSVGVLTCNAWYIRVMFVNLRLTWDDPCVYVSKVW